VALADIDVKLEILAHQKIVEARGREFVMILWIFPTSTSCPGFGMHNSTEIGLSIITNNSLALFDGVGVSLSPSVVVVLLVFSLL
jgi:hypothetical protein